MTHCDHLRSGSKRPAIQFVVQVGAPGGGGVSVVKGDPGNGVGNARESNQKMRFYGVSLNQIGLDFGD